ncbi:MAG: TolC family protein [Spirochaetales bacterium]|uniref:TolC family protein n=1 Tax=Candidatus Thalassospirochaeta sargassi TaxID=3119039 RepID=A0AAJ1ICG2_9SPIO|nr:TolC family protein [Spirochaetales bacterium]
MSNSFFLLIVFCFGAAASWSLELNLSEAQRMAEAASEDLRNTSQSLKLSTGGLNWAAAGLLPDVSLSMNATAATVLHSPDSRSLQFALNVSQPVFNGGRSSRTRLINELNNQIQITDLNSRQRELQNSIWTLYFNLLLNREKRLLNEELMKFSAEQLKIVREKYRMGSLTELDYLEAAVDVRNMELDLLCTLNEGFEMTCDFAVMTGFEPWYFDFEPLILTDEIDGVYTGLPLMDEDSPVWTRLALVNNSSINTSRLELHRNTIEYRDMKSFILPDIVIETSLYLNGEGLPLQDAGMTISLGFSFPDAPLPASLESGGSLNPGKQHSGTGSASISLIPESDWSQSLEAARNQLIQQEAELDSASIELEHSVHSLLIQLENKRKGLEIIRATHELKKKRLSILEKRTEIGEIKEQELLQARMEYYSDEIAFKESIVELMSIEQEFETLTGCGFGELPQLCRAVRCAGRDSEAVF